MTATLLPWLAPLADAAAKIRACRELSTGAEQVAALRRLSEHALSFAETAMLDRALERALKDGAPKLARFRLAWLGSSTVDHLVPAARVAGLRRGVLIESHVAPYGQYRQEVLSPSSEIDAFAPRGVLFAVDPFEAVPRLPLAAPAEEVERAIREHIDQLRVLWGRARERWKAIVLQQTMPDVALPLFGGFDGAVPAAPSSVGRAYDHALRTAAAADGVLLVDAGGWASRGGLDEWFSPARWHHAKQFVSPNAAPLYGDLVARLVGAVAGVSKKCLVLDLDNTVWGGVVGDDGIDGIALGPGSAAGEAHVAFQSYAKALAERGVILAVCSKNTAHVAEEAFRKHPEMVLRRDDIGAFFANWDDKPRNLRGIAETLNIDLSALVFVDDNPMERALVREALPMVAVPELPDDVAGYARRIADAGYFEAVAFTQDDRDRTKQYAANARREESRAAATDLDSFQRGLEMVMTASRFVEANLPRVTQLVNKTNQFNLTTRRYTDEELRALAGRPDVVHLSFRLADRFGDNGLISVVIAVPSDGTAAASAGASRAWKLDTWLMSCRVLGRGVELEVLNVVVAEAVKRGAETLVGEYVPSPKNGIVREHYAQLGFRRVEQAEQAKQTKADASGSLWTLDLRTYERRPNTIRTMGPSND